MNIKCREHLFPYSTRKKWLSHLRVRPSGNWPPGDEKWSYKNILKYNLTFFRIIIIRMYGTVFFDSVYHKKDIPKYNE